MKVNPWLKAFYERLRTNGKKPEVFDARAHRRDEQAAASHLERLPQPTTLRAANGSVVTSPLPEAGRHRYDLARLRRVTSLAAVLVHYGIDDALRMRGDELVGRCPLPGHAGDRDNREAFRANIPKGLWHCMTHCGGGDVVRLVALLEGGDHAAAARALARLEHCAYAPPSPPRPMEAPASTVTFRPYTATLRLEMAHPFLRARGITPRTAAHFEAGFWPLGGFLRGCAAVRIRDPSGRPLGYAGRRLEPDAIARYGKWKLPKGLPKAELLFNWHRARRYAERGLVVVEGAWDAMRVHQAGFPNVVALWGTTLLRAHRVLLPQAPTLTFAFDADDAGRRAARRCAHALHPTPVRIVELPDGDDPADLTDQRLRDAISFFS